MANEQQRPKVNDTEAARLKKEERARRARRRNRQLIGLALAVLIVVGAASIVNSGVRAVQGLMEGAEEETDQFRAMLEPFVWFDVLPFDSLENADQNALKQVLIWSIARTDDTLSRNEFGEAMITADKLDEYAMSVFGPSFRFAAHETFTDEVQGLTYEFDDATQTYMVPSTGLTPPYLATVVEVVRESGGVRRVVMGYVQSFGSVEGNQGGIAVPNLDSPAKYMDYMLRREGGNYYLYAVLNNTTHVPAAASEAAPPESEPAASLPAAPASVSQPPESTSLPGSEQTDESMDDSTESDSSSSEPESAA